MLGRGPRKRRGWELKGKDPKKSGVRNYAQVVEANPIPLKKRQKDKDEGNFEKISEGVQEKVPKNPLSGRSGRKAKERIFQNTK